EEAIGRLRPHRHDGERCAVTREATRADHRVGWRARASDETGAGERRERAFHEARSAAMKMPRVLAAGVPREWPGAARGDPAPLFNVHRTLRFCCDTATTP